jgi:long-chain acyl-CoA synthetase
MAHMIPDVHILRVVASLAADEMTKLRQSEISPTESLAWTVDTELGEGAPGALGLDSLGRIDVATRVNQFFHLHETGVEDYLLIERTLGGWVRIVREALRLGALHVGFRTSGSTGAAKTCTHAMAQIEEEADALAEALEKPKRIISLVPPHHIYGFIFTVVLPSRLDAPVIDARSLPPGRLKAALAEGDAIVATPHLWRYLAGSLGGFPAGVTGTSSTAPLPADLAQELIGAGLVRLTEVYGSSETSGIGWRRDPAAPFALMPFWVLGPDGQSIRRGAGELLPFPDLVAVEGGRFVRPVGRRDGAVQVGGINVFPERVRQVLLGCQGVAEAAVRAFAVDGDAARQRLKAFVVPAAAGADAVALEAALRRHAGEALTAVERPAAYAFGPDLPRNAMGKLADWGQGAS